MGQLSAPAHAVTLPLLRTGRVLALAWMAAGPSPTQTVSHTACRMCVPALCNGVKNENLSGTELVHSRTYCYLFCSFATLTGINHVPLIAAMIKSTKTLNFLTFRAWFKLLREMACLASSFYLKKINKLKKHLLFPVFSPHFSSPLSPS